MSARCGLRPLPRRRRRQARHRTTGWGFRPFFEFALYILLLPPLGFRIATFLFVLSLQVTLEWPRSTKHWVLAVLVAAATSLICFLIFQGYLQGLLPRGTWSNM